MNRNQLPRELKAAFCQRILQGEWTMEQAADISTFTIPTVKRWLQSHAASNRKEAEATPQPAPAKPAEPLRWTLTYVVSQKGAQNVVRDLFPLEKDPSNLHWGIDTKTQDFIVYTAAAPATGA